MEYGGSSGVEGRRLVGNYIVGPRIGSGSFAVVWKGWHRQSGLVVAVKEIDKRHLLKTSKSNSSLIKEISILSNIRHPNIIHLFEAIETKDRIYLILEYCNGGDLASYIQRHGKVSQTVARHFMRQLAAGLQVLKESCLIHRDLKPQNLLLSNNVDMTPVLKIGDFGFARYLTPQSLADTLCGSPLYMAPEIIQNKKYDGKADLWSAGAILFQLVTGKPPFQGDSQLQLFQNILTSTELQFPQCALEELHPDCLDLCRRLLCQNAVERLTFEKFFAHKFLLEPIDSSPDYSPSHHNKNLSPGCLSSTETDENLMLNVLSTCSRGEACSSDELKATDSMESIEKGYVFVNAHSASTETFSFSSETSLQHSSLAKIRSFPQLKNEKDTVVLQNKDFTAMSTCSFGSLPSHESNPSTLASMSPVLRDVDEMPVLPPKSKMQLLYQYIISLSELAQIRFNAGSYIDSFSVELVVLAVWKEALEVCSSWLTCIKEKEHGGPQTNESTSSGGAASSANLEGDIDFSRPELVSLWAEQGFIAAYDRADKLSNHVKVSMQMPDAMEIIFQRALEVGRSGGVDELMGNNDSAAAAYSKAKLLLHFILVEAATLPLNPPVSLSIADKKRIKVYIDNFESRESFFKHILNEA